MSTYGYTPTMPVVGTCAVHHGTHEHTDTCALFRRGAK